MPLSTLINRQITITRRTPTGEKDAYGNRLHDEVDVQTVGELQQTARAERADAGETSDTTWDLFLLPGTAIDTGDQVTTLDDGLVYEVVGEPWKARNPRTQAESHIEATLRRTAGSATS